MLYDESEGDLIKEQKIKERLGLENTSEQRGTAVRSSEGKTPMLDEAGETLPDKMPSSFSSSSGPEDEKSMRRCSFLELLSFFTFRCPGQRFSSLTGTAPDSCSVWGVFGERWWQVRHEAMEGGEMKWDVKSL